MLFNFHLPNMVTPHKSWSYDSGELVKILFKLQPIPRGRGLVPRLYCPIHLSFLWITATSNISRPFENPFWRERKSKWICFNALYPFLIDWCKMLCNPTLISLVWTKPTDCSENTKLETICLLWDRNQELYRENM